MRTALRSTSSLAAVSLLALGACGGPSGTDDAALGTDAGAPIDTGVAIDAFSAEDAPAPNDAPAAPDAVRLPPDAFVSIDATEPTMPTYSYVVSVVAADEVEGGQVAGIDIDGMDSGRGRGAGTCEQRRPDFVSSVTMLPGVDNQLSNTLLSTLTSMGVDINRNLEAAIADGTFLLLVTVDDLEDFVNDTDGVSVTIGLGTTVSGSPPTLSGGLIAPGQSFRRTMTLGTGTATLTGNRVIVSVPRIPIPLVLGGTATADLEDSQLSARISATELFDGEGGGGLSVQALVDFAATNGFGDEAMALLPMFSDLNPSAEDSAVCESISAGFRLEAVSATVVP
ncbi:MAG: hypothetical protein J0L92_15020 [Deltaproteobacteria bacterium]|nr:hypothetical protein [Deltaproteobacteria bacterium]